ncbi:acyl CoA:acetate/3-ketoacid CoA transferase [Paraburkholderia caledonica]|uniref:acyl CoA:acetate/3-ketoacid CoA transferase n=1 Tax=Paraburkholderia caledonica TaxID=134536 RepID=UPI000B22C30C|nr:CoA-transferase [Paraburkholderia caledonica]
MQHDSGRPFGPRVITASQAADLIDDGDCVYFGGSGGGHGVAEGVIEALRDRFERTGNPVDLTAASTVSIGDWQDTGFNHLAARGLLRRVINGGMNNCPKLAPAAIAGELECYTLPQGVLAQMARERAAGRPGVLTKVGIGTFVDPRQSGGRQGAGDMLDDLVDLVDVRGDEYLLYRAFPVDVAVLRGTTADENGHITMEEEAFLGENLALAMGAKRNGGVVIVQVRQMAAAGSLHPRSVEIPAHLVDYLVVAPEQRQTYNARYEPAFAGHLRVPESGFDPLPFDIRKVIARRAAMELYPRAIVNLGFGMSNGISAVAAEEGIYRDITLTVEQGVIGGVPAGGKNHGAGVNFDMLARHPDQFDFYDGGGLDQAFLSFAEVDRHGNVNVSRYGDMINGPGGFINISQGAKRVAFLGTLTTGGLSVHPDGEGALRIEAEGRTRKWVKDVGQITFNGRLAVERGQLVRYITDRAVFELDRDGLVLVEIAPGIDLRRDVLEQIEFDVRVSPELRTMDARLYRQAPLGWKTEFDARRQGSQTLKGNSP